jgi:hypothetical protein
MSDPLADRLKRLSEQHGKQHQAEVDIGTRQKSIDDFISGRSPGEYERLLTLISKRIDEVNPEIGDLPSFKVTRKGEIEQGNAGAYLNFDKPILNAPNNRLMISFAPHRDAMYSFTPRPAPERYQLQATASTGLEHIVWAGDLGELTSEKLADFILEHLTSYYLEIKPTG